MSGGVILPRVAAAGGRALLALLFVLAGLAKILGPQPYLDHMRAVSVPTLLLPAVIGLELGAGLLLLAGWRANWAAAALAGFCLLTASLFHHQLGDKVERTSFFKDLAIAGGLLVVASRRTEANAG